MTLIRRSFLLLLVVCLGCVAQSASPDLTRKIERQVRSYYKIPAEIHMLVGAPSPSSEFPNYESLIVTVDSEGKKTGSHLPGVQRRFFHGAADQV